MRSLGLFLGLWRSRSSGGPLPPFTPSMNFSDIRNGGYVGAISAFVG